MSLFNQLTYYMLIAELLLFLATLLPMSFIGIGSRKRIMNGISSLAKKEPIVWTARIIFFVVAGVFLDTVNRLFKMESEIDKDHMAGHHHVEANPLAELQQKARLFYTQRNLYLSLFTIFMILVDYRRIRDVYLQLVYQEELLEHKKKVRVLTQQIEQITGVAAARDSPAVVAKEVKTAPVVVEKVIDSELVEPEGARRRTGKSEDLIE